MKRMTTQSHSVLIKCNTFCFSNMSMCSNF
uniref:Uncharacterized protein n=1 Tax=Arundo donax TaxID=35708 RepID=A0A0A9GUE0_ARUDO